MVVVIYVKYSNGVAYANKTVGFHWDYEPTPVTLTTDSTGAISPAIAVPDGTYMYTVTVNSVDYDGSISVSGDVGESTVTLSFAATMTITSASAGNGTISPSGTNTFDIDSMQTFTAIPAEGYVVDYWDINGAQHPDAGSRSVVTFKMIAAYDGATLTVHFKPAGPSPPWLLYAAIVAGATCVGYIVWRMVR